MTWKEQLLFYIKANGGILSRRSAENLLISFFDEYKDAAQHIMLLSAEDLCEFDNSTGQLKMKSKGDIFIERIYTDIKILMQSTRKSLDRLKIRSPRIDIKGETTGIFFIYKNQTFRFTPDYCNGAPILKARLPNSLDETKGFDPNLLYVKLDILQSTTFLEDVVTRHLNMLDEIITNRLLPPNNPDQTTTHPHT